MYSIVVGGKTLEPWQIENVAAINTFIFSNAGPLFGLLKDEDVQVRRQILLTTNYLLRQNSASLIPDEAMKAVVAPSVLNETLIRSELIKKIEIGPHKDIQDNGFEARKAAFACLSTLIGAYPNILGVEDLLSHLVNAFTDKDAPLLRQYLASAYFDIAIAAIQILTVVATSSFTSSDMVPHVDKYLTPVLDGAIFPATTGKKISEDEIELMEHLKRNAVCLVASMKNIPGMLKNAPAFDKLVTKISKDSALSTILKEAEQSVNSEATQNPGK